MRKTRGESPVTENRRRSRVSGEAGSIEDRQLLARVIRPGSSWREADRIASELLEKCGGLRGLAEASRREITGTRGMGPARAQAVLAAFELGSRCLAEGLDGERLLSSADVYRTFWPKMVRERVEVFRCATLDSKLRMVRTEEISRGTISASIVHPREAFRPAVKDAASGVVFAHNHPSGDPLPSEEDRRITARLEEAGRILGIPVLDHVVLGVEGSYYSFADAGCLAGDGGGYRGMLLRQRFSRDGAISNDEDDQNPAFSA